MASPYSQASSNFSDSMSGGVDPRTGLYSASLLLAHLKANGTSGPFLPLSLKYDPMSSIDMGFGVGWGLSWSHYSTDDGVLSLSTGDRYSTTMQSGNLALKDQKIVSAKLRQTDGVYHVQNRKGDTHILGRYVSGNLWVPSRILAPNGLGVTLIWNNDGRLKSIVDELAEDGDTPQTLVEIDYSNALKTTVTLWPGTDTQKVITVILPGGTNSAIYFGGLAWIMHYDDSIRSFGKPPLCRIEYPSGAIETVTYTSDEDGHRYPLCAPQAASQTIPYVSEYRKKIVGNDTDRVINYSFSAKNFVGYQSGISEWKANGDNLYEADKNYTYQSFETRYDGNNNKIKTTNEYNKFHLLTRTMVEKNGTVQATKYTYDLVDGNFQAQCNHFQQATKVDVTYTSADGRSHSETTTNEYDEDANKIKTVTYDGTVQTWEYYPADGSDQNCPAAPLGVKTFLKTHETIPPSGDGKPSAPRRKTINKYSALDTDAGSPILQVIVPVRSEHYADDVLLNASDTEYYNCPSQFHHARAKSQKKTVYSDSGTPYTNRVDLVYSLDSGQLITGSTTASFDGLSKKSTMTICAYSGAALERTNAQSNKEAYSYDGLGRIAAHSICSGDDVYEHTVSYAYGTQPTDDGTQKFRYTTITDPQGIIHKELYNGEGKVLSSFTNTENGDQQLLGHEYDTLGRLQTVTLFDNVGTAGVGQTASGDAASSTVQDTRTLIYDDWGQQDQSSLSSGSEFLQHYDPTTIQTLERFGQEDTVGSRLTEFDSCYHPSTITLQKASGETAATTYVICDGSGRQISHTDADGNTTTYQYDSFNRVIKTTYADGTIVTKTYAAHSSASLVTSIAVNGTVIGTQEFDGLSRLTSRTVGGRVHRFAYKNDAASKPCMVTLPNSKTIKYDLIPQLGEAPKTITGWDGTVRSFEYNPTSGLLLKVTQSVPGGGDDALVITLTYTDRKKVKTRTVSNLIENTTRIISYDYSIGGALLGYTDPKNGKTSFKYDEYGRKSEITDSRSTTTISYNTNNLVSEWNTKSGSHISRVTIEYDEFSREVKRTISDNNSYLTLIVALEYDVLGRVLKKTTTTNNAGNPLVEQFTYDSRSRLVNVTYQGDGRPQDESGSPMTDIQYAYDAYGNITKKTINTDGGPRRWSFTYGNFSDPCILMSMTKPAANGGAGPVVRQYFQYDDCGRLLTAEEGTLAYDAFGQLANVTKSNGDVSTYQYDGLGTLRLQKNNGTNEKREFFYLNGKVVSEVQTVSGSERFIGRTFFNGNCLTQYMDNDATFLIGCDYSGSILSASRNGQDSLFKYSPYGDRTGSTEETLPGYNGEIIDDATGYYHLGNGYRIYIPSLMRFNKPDTESPFGQGGINWFAYGDGDPINNADPTGHYTVEHHAKNTAGVITAALIGVFAVGAAVWFAAPAIGTLFAEGISMATAAPAALATVSVAATVTSTGLGIASAAEKPKHPDKAATLQTLSIAFGVVSAVSGFAATKLASTVVEDAAETATLERDVTDTAIHNEYHFHTHLSDSQTTFNTYSELSENGYNTPEGSIADASEGRAASSTHIDDPVAPDEPIYANIKPRPLSTASAPAAIMRGFSSVSNRSGMSGSLVSDATSQASLDIGTPALPPAPPPPLPASLGGQEAGTAPAQQKFASSPAFLKSIQGAQERLRKTPRSQEFLPPRQ